VDVSTSQQDGAAAGAPRNHWTWTSRRHSRTVLLQVCHATTGRGRLDVTAGRCCCRCVTQPLDVDVSTSQQDGAAAGAPRNHWTWTSRRRSRTVLLQVCPATTGRGRLDVTAGRCCCRCDAQPLDVDVSTSQQDGAAAGATHNHWTWTSRRHSRTVLLQVRRTITGRGFKSTPAVTAPSHAAAHRQDISVGF